MADGIQPPVPVGYIDGSLDPAGLDQDSLAEYREHVERTRVRNHQRKHGKGAKSKGDKTDATTEDDCQGIRYAKDGDVDRLRELLESGWDPSTVDKHGSNALHWAAGAGNIEILALLLKHGININGANRCQRLLHASSM